jgi:hypothetical protein
VQCHTICSSLSQLVNRPDVRSTSLVLSQTTFLITRNDGYVWEWNEIWKWNSFVAGLIDMKKKKKNNVLYKKVKIFVL